MDWTIETIKANANTVEKQILILIYEQQVETNRLLAILMNENDTGSITPVDDTKPAEGQTKRRGRPKNENQ